MNGKEGSVNVYTLKWKVAQVETCNKRRELNPTSLKCGTNRGNWIIRSEWELSLSRWEV